MCLLGRLYSRQDIGVGGSLPAFSRVELLEQVPVSHLGWIERGERRASSSSTNKKCGV